MACTGPQGPSGHCFYCMASEGSLHDDGCSWVEARCYLDKTDEYREALVGDDWGCNDDPPIPEVFRG